MNKYSVIDIETDGLIDEEGEKKGATRIYCMSVCRYDRETHQKETFTLIDYNQMEEFLQHEECLIGHNIVRFDIPMLEKLIGIKIKARKIDTLGLSWYLYPGRIKHGLESWGDDLGIKKPEIEDWQNLSIEEYIYRCEQDVQINFELFQIQMHYLLTLYDSLDEALRLCGYLSFKLDCAREQEEVKWRLDIETTKANLEFLKEEKIKKVNILREVMPKQVVYKNVVRPKAIYKKDGTPSEVGKRWLTLLEEKGLPEHHVGTIQIPVKEVPGKPTSHDQLKTWLFSLGWKPDHYKYVKEEDGSNRKIPQIANEDGTSVSDSVKALYEKCPELENLEDLFKIQHRVGLLEGFLESVDSEGFIKSLISGFTNTLRMQHKKPIANLPTIPKKYWERVRGCLVYPKEGWELCGSDMSGLEDSTKRHYMWQYDPAYVTEMMGADFDPHLDIAVLAGLLTKEQANEHKLYEATKGEQGKSWKAIRLKAKKVNFAGVYGAGAPKLSITANIPLSEAKTLHTTYWKRNWSVKKIAEDAYVKKIGDQLWLWNPVSQFYYSLRVEKDKFSTLNQGTGVFCFDTWVRNIRKQGVKICCQYHDEVVIPVPIQEKEILKQVLNTAIKDTNDELKLNVELRISIAFGKSYADIH